MSQEVHTAVQASPQHGYRSTKLPDIKLLVWVFLASDAMFFGSLIGTFVAYKGRSVVGPFPKDVLDIPLPQGRERWDEAAALVGEGPAAVDRIAALMHEAYGGSPELMEWWQRRRA